jgi:hypothetical protein
MWIYMLEGSNSDIVFSVKRNYPVIVIYSSCLPFSRFSSMQYSMLPSRESTITPSAYFSYHMYSAVAILCPASFCIMHGSLMYSLHR